MVTHMRRGAFFGSHAIAFCTDVSHDLSVTSEFLVMVLIIIIDLVMSL